jgi:nucleotide-binding universal stress UspA family protein
MLALLGARQAGRVTLFGVVESDEALPTLADVVPRNVALQVQSARRDRVREGLTHAAGRAQDFGLDATVDFDTGQVAARIVEWVERREATLIAMGTHGRSGPSRWVLGSVTEKVLRASHAPLLICK